MSDTAKKEWPQCVATINVVWTPDGTGLISCEKNGRHIEDGKPYCGYHRPSTVRHKWKEKKAKWDREFKEVSGDE